LVVISTEENLDWGAEETIDPKLQKVIDILKALSPEERDIVLDKCESTDGE
jgi:hypothetical protein